MTALGSATTILLLCLVDKSFSFTQTEMVRSVVTNASLSLEARVDRLMGQEYPVPRMEPKTSFQLHQSQRQTA